MSVIKAEQHEALGEVKDQADNFFEHNTEQYPVFVERLFKLADPVTNLHHASTGMAGEAGEIIDLTKKVWIYGKELNIEKLVEEMGDLRFYYQAMLNQLGLMDTDIIALNMIKLNKRFPSGTFSAQDAIAQGDKKPGADRAFIGKPTEEQFKREMLGTFEVELNDPERCRFRLNISNSPYCEKREDLKEAGRRWFRDTNSNQSFYLEHDEIYDVSTGKITKR